MVWDGWLLAVTDPGEPRCAGIRQSVIHRSPGVSDAERDRGRGASPSCHQLAWDPLSLALTCRWRKSLNVIFIREVAVWRLEDHFNLFEFS
jgi:hypothetical protein